MISDLPDGLHVQVAHLLGELAEKGCPTVVLVLSESGKWHFFHNVESEQQCEKLIGEGSEKILDALAAGKIERKELSSRVN